MGQKGFWDFEKAFPGLLCLTKVDFVQVGQFFEDLERKL